MFLGHVIISRIPDLIKNTLGLQGIDHGFVETTKNKLRSPRTT